MDATAIALLITTIGSLITAGATALAGLRQSRAALLAAEGAAALRATAGTRAFPQISSGHELLGQRIAGLLPERDFYERAALLRALGVLARVATRLGGVQ